MISQIRNCSFIRFLWGLMGLYLLNISVDASDLNHDWAPEDLTINEQESVIEIVLEHLLGFDNALPEYDDPDCEDHNKKNNVKIDLAAHFSIDRINKITTLEKAPLDYPDYLSAFHIACPDLITPPPKI